MALLSNSNIGIGRRNYIINGDFRLWQRGTDRLNITSSGSRTYLADRFYVSNFSDGVLRYTQSQSVPTVSESGHYFTDSLYFIVTTADTSLSSSQYSAIGYSVEGYDARALYANTYITLSFWIRAYKTGIYSLSIRNATPDRSYVSEYVINQSNAWEKKIITIPMYSSLSSGTWETTYNEGFSIWWTIAAPSGGTYSTSTLDTWLNGNYIASNNQVNGLDSINNEVRLNGVQLEVGSIATDFEMRHISEELNLAKRYCQIIQGGSGSASSTTSAEFAISFSPSMRTTPSTVTASAAMKIEDPAVTGYTQSAAAANLQYASSYGCKLILGNFTGLTAAKPYINKR
jgi:hypothetical protein